MKNVLIDNTNTIIYEGNDAKKLLEVLLKDLRDVTEEDEVSFEEQLRTLEWTGDLRHETHFDLKFKGIDNWNRPVFKDIDSNIYFGSVHVLVPSKHIPTTNPVEITNWFKGRTYLLEFFGNKFNCEPHGDTATHWKLNLIDL